MRVGGVGIFGTAFRSCGAGVIGLPGTGAKSGRSTISVIAGTSPGSGFSVAANSSRLAASVTGFDSDGREATSVFAVVVASVGASVAAETEVSSAVTSVGDSSFFLSGGRKPPIGGRKGFAPLPAIWIEGRAAAEAARPIGESARLAEWRARSGRGSSSSEYDASSASCFFSRNLSRTLFAVESSTELEWVFLSATPTSASTASTSEALTSSSRASSLIRIFLLPVTCLA